MNKVILVLLVLAFVAAVAAGKGKGTATTGTVTGKSGSSTSTPVRLANSRLAGRARSGIAAPTLNNFDLYAIGGTISSNTALSDVDKYSLFNNTWRSVAALNVNRNAPGAAGLDGLVYTFGGIGDGLSILTSTEVYNPETNSWTFGPSLSTGRWNLGGVQLCTEIYAIGGYVSAGPTPDGTGFIVGTTDVVEVYSVLTSQWISTTPLPESRAAFGAVTINNNIWVIGGTREFLTGTAQSPLVSTRVFNTSSRVWFEGPDLRQARVGFGAVVIDNKIIIAGGRTQDGPLLSAIEFYDPLTPELGFQLASFSPRTLRFNNAVGAIANTLFLIGGRVTNANSFSFTNVVEPITIIS